MNVPWSVAYAKQDINILTIHPQCIALPTSPKYEKIRGGIELIKDNIPMKAVSVAVNTRSYNSLLIHHLDKEVNSVLSLPPRRRIYGGTSS